MGFSVHTTDGVEINIFETLEKAKNFAYRLKGKQTGINYFIYRQELVYITGSEHLLSCVPYTDPVNLVPVPGSTFFVAPVGLFEVDPL